MAALCCALESAPLAAQEPARERRLIHGTAVDSVSGNALRGALVGLSGVPHGTTIALNGTFDFRDIAPGTYTLTVRLIGYAPVSQRVDVRLADAHVRVALPPVVVRVEDITVNADSIRAVLSRIEATSTITADDLTALRGQTLGETIRQLPGVTTIQYGPSIAKPVIRGLHSHRIVVMNSGIRQEGQQWGTEHAPEIDSFEADAVSVIRGAGTVQYGSDAMGGVVTVDRPPLPHTSGLRGDFQLNSFINNRQGAASLRLEAGELRAPLLGTFAVRGRLTGRMAGDAHTPDYNLQNTGFRELNGSAALGIRRSWGESDLLYSRFNTELGVFRGAHVGNFEDLERAMTRPPSDTEFSYDIGRPNQKVLHNLIAWRTLLRSTPLGPISANFGYQYNRRQEFDSHGQQANRGIPAFDLRLNTYTLDLRTQHHAGGNLTGTLGVSGMRQGNVSEGKAFLIPEYRLYSAGIYGLEELTLSRWTLSAGLRWDYTWQQTYEYADAGIVSPEESRDWSGVAGNVGASFLLGGSWSIAGRVTRTWRPPNVNERFAQGVHHGSAQYEIGDSSLVPERKVGVEGTVRHAGADVQLELTAFQNWVSGFIYLQPRDPVFSLRGTFPAYNYAQADAVLRGFEALTAWTPAPWLSLQASASVVRGTFADGGEPLYDMPADRLTLSARYQGAGREVRSWHVEVGTVLVRQQDHVPDSTVYSLPTDGYALLNAEAGAAGFDVLGSALEVTLAVRNLLNTRYRDYLSRYRLFVDDPGRDVVLRLRIPFGLP